MKEQKAVRVVFMGTSRFAVASLEALSREGYEVVGVVTQPARPAGRGRTVLATAVAEAAERLRLLVLTPEKLRAPDAVQQVADLRPEVIVVAAYAQILPRSVLTLPARGCINVHASLLPRWRGASPMQSAILAGDEFTGVSIMLMEPSMDTGPVLGQTMTRIEDSDTTPVLEDRLARAGAALLTSVLPCYLAGRAVPVPQDESLATYASLIKKEDGLIDWGEPARRIWLKNRAYQPWPGSYTFWDGRMLRIASCVPDEGIAAGEEPGTVVAIPGGKKAGVTTGEGILRLEQVAPEGSRTMAIGDFLAGHKGFLGSRLGKDDANRSSGG